MSLWLPNNMNYDAYRVDRIVREYDDRLMFARNEETGDWCVFIRMPRPSSPYPVLGFGREIPDTAVVMQRLQEADTLRTGNQIYNEVIRSQKDYRKNLEYNADQASAESAEVVEHFLRKHGKSPIVKILPKGVSNNDA